MIHMNKQLVQKFVEVEKTISSEKGPFLLFALFLPEEAVGGWDVLAAAPWIGRDKGAAMKYLVKNIQQVIAAKELVRVLSKIVLIDEDNPGLDDVHQAVNVEHGIVLIKSEFFFGLEIKRAYFITSQEETMQAEEDMDMALSG